MYTVEYRKNGAGVTEINLPLVTAEKYFDRVAEELRAWSTGGWVRLLKYSSFYKHPEVISQLTVI